MNNNQNNNQNRNQNNNQNQNQNQNNQNQNNNQNKRGVVIGQAAGKLPAALLLLSYYFSPSSTCPSHAKTSSDVLKPPMGSILKNTFQSSLRLHRSDSGSCFVPSYKVQRVIWVTFSQPIASSR